MIIRVYGYATPPGPLSPEQMAENDITEQVQVEPTPDARAQELHDLYGYAIGRGIATVDTDPQPPAATYRVVDSAVQAADTVLADPDATAEALRTALTGLRAALIPA